MSNPFLRDCMIDVSDETDFRFALHCTVCGKRWDAPPTPVSAQAAAEGFTARTYQNERIWALDEAACHADAYFDLCPICGRVVCRDCLSTYRRLTMCGVCRTTLMSKLES